MLGLRGLSALPSGSSRTSFRIHHTYHKIGGRTRVLPVRAEAEKNVNVVTPKKSKWHTEHGLVLPITYPQVPDFLKIFHWRVWPVYLLDCFFKKRLRSAIAISICFYLTRSQSLDVFNSLHVNMQLMGLRGRSLYLEAQMTGAYDEQLARPIDEGFSDVARRGREQLLQGARDGMRAARGRVSNMTLEITIDPILLPGAMSLLEQVGDFYFATNNASSSATSATNHRAKIYFLPNKPNKAS